jgi:hypothetical protein
MPNQSWQQKEISPHKKSKHTLTFGMRISAAVGQFEGQISETWSGPYPARFMGLLVASPRSQRIEAWIASPYCGGE